MMNQGSTEQSYHLSYRLATVVEVPKSINESGIDRDARRKTSGSEVLTTILKTHSAESCWETNAANVRQGDRSVLIHHVNIDRSNVCHRVKNGLKTGLKKSIIESKNIS